MIRMLRMIVTLFVRRQQDRAIFSKFHQGLRRLEWPAFLPHSFAGVVNDSGRPCFPGFQVRPGKQNCLADIDRRNVVGGVVSHRFVSGHAVILLLLAGCSSVPTAPKEVRIPIPVSCIDRPPAKPSMLSDAELLALDDYGLVIALARDRRIRQGYEAELESVIEACTGAGS